MLSRTHAFPPVHSASDVHVVAPQTSGVKQTGPPSWVQPASPPQHSPLPHEPQTVPVAPVHVGRLVVVVVATATVVVVVVGSTVCLHVSAGLSHVPQRAQHAANAFAWAPSGVQRSRSSLHSRLRHAHRQIDSASGSPSHRSAQSS